MSDNYGAPISVPQARAVAVAAVAEATQSGWTMAVAIVDTAGHLVYFERMADVQIGSVVVCQEKARSAVLFKRPTRAFQQMLEARGGGLRVVRIKGAIPVAGGVPIVLAGSIVGAVGVSGGTSEQDD